MVGGDGEERPGRLVNKVHAVARWHHGLYTYIIFYPSRVYFLSDLKAGGIGCNYSTLHFYVLA